MRSPSVPPQHEEEGTLTPAGDPRHGQRRSEGAGSAETDAPLVDVSVLTPVYNEERHIRDTVAAMQAQTYAGTVEFLLADGRSEDRTREVLEEFAARDPRIRIFENPERTIPSGLNLLLREARGRYVARMDGHAEFPPDYLARAVERLERGDVDWVSGPMVPVGRDRWSRRVALALSTRLGVGSSGRWAAVAGDGEGDDPVEVELDSGVFCGVWVRSVVEDFGGWDEGWPRNQDSELAARFLKSGKRLVGLPELGARYAPRNDLRSLARQYYGYGFYRAKTASRHPETLRRGHLLPPGLVGAAALSFVAPRGIRRMARAGLALYAVALGRESVLALRHAEPMDALALPVVFATMHGAWGAGFLRGCARFGPPLEAIPHLVPGSWFDGVHAPARSAGRFHSSGE